MMPGQGDLARTLAEAEALASTILRRDAEGERGLAVETARAIIKRLPPADALSLVSLKPKQPMPLPFDPSAMVG